MQKVQLNTVSGFEEVREYYFVCREEDCCWVEGKDGKVISGRIMDKGYRQMGLMMNTGKMKDIYQHRIFMICFTPNPENKEQVNHLDGVKSNNLLSNLDWATSSENRQHALATGLAKSGEQHGSAKLRDSEIPLIFQMRQTGMTQREIGDHFGISKQQIHNILSGKQRSQNLQISQPTSLLQF